ncbi:unnamed protein product [Auanema sp. JU1783]|nr:unnamed protein product [Auanema sp. JU1783]
MKDKRKRRSVPKKVEKELELENEEVEDEEELNHKEVEDEEELNHEEVEDEEELNHEEMDDAEISEGGQTMQADEELDNEEEYEDEAAQERKAVAKKTAVLYFSHIPEGFSPGRMKSYFEKYAPNAVGRVYLARNKRVTHKHLYTEGWIEIKKKRLAKRLAEMLNGREVGGRRADPVSSVIWNVMYLSGFKWFHLVEQLNYEKNVEDKRLQTEIAQIRKISSAYEENVEKGMNLKKLEERVLKQGGKWEQYKRQFEQRSGKKKERNNDEVETKDVMKMIFG